MLLPKNKKINYLIPISLFFSALLIGGAIIYNAGSKAEKTSKESKTFTGQVSKTQEGLSADVVLEEKIAPFDGVELPVKLGNLGKQLVESGVVAQEKFEALYAGRGGLTDEQKKLLYGENNGNLVINPENAGFVLNLLWALGLGNKNEILENGPMADPHYGGADRFASTGGWTLSKGETMNHYSKHQFIPLSAEQQALVEKVSKNIYRPCCNNSTYFPDCNHGMAMLGFLELAASQGASENALYGMALVLNSYWFPDTYLTIAKYFESKGVSWDKVNPREVLGMNYSSGSGYRRILTQIAPPERKGGGSCGV